MSELGNIPMDFANDSDLFEMLSEIIENSDIRIVFQPIVSLADGSVLGYEALSRGPEGTKLMHPDALFGTAVKCGKLLELELLCRAKALEAAYRNGSKIKLFLNVNPFVIHDEKFKRGFTKEYLKNYHIGPENIYFEITEKSAVEDLNGFKKTIEHYKRQNYKIVIDDAGAGYSGLNMITDIHPHYIKLDMKLIRGIDSDGYKKALVKSLCEFCRLSDISLIAEGIETEDELGALIDIGVHYGQGYLIQKPGELSPVGDDVVRSIARYNAKKGHGLYHCLTNTFIGDICRHNITVTSDDLAENVYKLFLKDDLLTGITVVDQGAVAGIVTKTRIDHMMSGQFGFSLHSKRPIFLLMDKYPLITDCKMPIDAVSKLAMARPADTLYDFIVVTKDEKYCGIVTIKDLLEKTMELEVSNARHLNPLSGLPGNLMIEHRLMRCISSDDPFTVLYVDIDNFKAYNDVYGFGNGDNVLRFVAALLTDLIPRGEFIGHVGGDDFVAILSSYMADGICRLLTRRFDEGIRDFYTADDLKRGYIAAKNRKGNEDQFSIMTVSVAGVSNRGRSYHNINQLSEHASVIKKKCKLVLRSCHMIV